jgi:hypothetical protein
MLYSKKLVLLKTRPLDSWIDMAIIILYDGGFSFMNALYILVNKYCLWTIWYVSYIMQFIVNIMVLCKK